MSGYTCHGIDHLSASSLNLWAAEPAVWAMERLLGHRSPPSALMARGKAVEEGVHAGSWSRVAMSAPASRRRSRPTTARWRSIPMNGERASAPRSRAMSSTVWPSFGSMVCRAAYQERVEIRLDEVPVPHHRLHRLALRSAWPDRRSQDQRAAAVSHLAVPCPPGCDLRQRTWQLRHALRLREAHRRQEGWPRRRRSTNSSAPRSTGSWSALREIALRLERFLRSVDGCPRALRPDRPRLRALPLDQPVTRARGAEVFGF